MNFTTGYCNAGVVLKKVWEYEFSVGDAVVSKRSNAESYQFLKPVAKIQKDFL
jgi:hypothetical protein